MSATFGCVILTRGDRPSELQRAVDSVTAQVGVTVDCLVVVNGGGGPSGVSGARLLCLPENLGIPAGRNRGVDAVEGEFVLFLDDDGYLRDTDVLERAREAFRSDPTLGVLSLRITDPEGRAGQRRHVPRLRAGDPARSSDVTTFLGGACIIRREVFERVGVFPAEFFFGHEETSLAWRALDADFRIRYDASLEVLHPSAPPTRHAFHHYLSSRNRVWLARLHLPTPIAFVYCVVWLVASLLRAGTIGNCSKVLRGFSDGLASSPARPRRRIRWQTAWRMCRLGRPPVV
jgi:GT2 family glycosyltransferase